LLEAMNEHQVSIDGRTYPLEQPFFVLATQNPFEFEGTYPLPENQLDRFMLRIDVGYPERTIERDVLKQHRGGEPVDKLQAVLTSEQLRSLQASVREVRVDDSLNDYILDLVHGTREHDELILGVSTRGALIFYRAAQSLAVLEGRDYVIPDDVKQLAIPVLSHRVVCRGLIRENQRERANGIIQQIVDATPIPN
jgi:MoxR-like ATPase